MDRRIHRKKYDVSRTFEVFSVKLRDETDLDALNNELAGWWGRRCRKSTPVVAAARPATRRSVRATPKLNSRLGSKCLTAFDRNGCTCCRIFVVDFHSRGN